MNKRYITGLILIISFLALSLVWTTVAQEEFRLNWWTAISGGSAASDSGAYQLSDAIGQTVASTQQVSNSGGYGLGSGFMYGMLDTTSPYFPVLLQADSGYANIWLAWNITNAPDVGGYRVSRAISGTVDLTPIVTVSDPMYIDDAPDLVAGTTYCYQIAALDTSGRTLLQSNQDCTVFGALELWVPEVWVAPDEAVNIPINIKNAEGLPIALAEIWVEYDCAIIGSPVTVSGTSLTLGYSWNVTESDDGTNCQARVTTNGGAEPPIIHGEGSLFWLFAPIDAVDGEETPLNLREFITGVGGTVIYSPEDMTTSIPLILDDGTLHVGEAGPYRLGDLNGDATVQVVDGEIALDIANGLVVPTPEQIGAGDVNGDGRITAADASMIIFYAINGYWPHLSNGLMNSPQATIVENTTPITVSVGIVTGAPGEIIEVDLIVSDVVDLAGGDFSIVFTQNLIDHIVSVTPVGIAGNFVVGQQSFNDTGSGLLTFSFADDVVVSGSGVIATITLEIDSDAPVGSSTMLDLVFAQLNDANGRDFATSNLQIPVLRENGLLTVIDDGADIYLPMIVR